MKNATSLVILAITLMVMLVATLFYDQQKAIESSKVWVLHTYDVTGHIQLFFSRLKDMEVGHRGYLVTHDEEYLAPYYDALKDSLGNDASSAQLQEHHSVREELAILRSLTIDNAVQQRNLDELNSDVDQLVAYWATDSKPATDGTQGPLANADFHREDQLVDQIHRLVNIMIAEENRLLVTRAEAAEGSRRSINLFIFWGIFGFYICIVLAIVLYQKSREKSRARLV
ncbi:MAG: CHASE3 domain-containing protein, partial [Pseudomonadota bacterium]|nr:CHASE3 domain-containing protein [Pseudomonadota bacterium]